MGLTDPTAELLQAMAECGLHPKNIIWDGRWRRFPGIDQTRGDNGRYRAFPDQRGALFMDMRTKEQWRWPQDNPLWKEKMKHLEPLSAEEVRKKKKEAEERRARDAKKHTKQIRDMWDRAKPVGDRGHPYLEAKGITGHIVFLRSIIDPETEQEMLLIPMRNRKGEMMCLQRIWPDGRRLYMPQAAGTRGLYETIAGERYMENKTLFVCEGWATGWSISKATGCAVIVAFFDGGLLTIGRILQEKYPEAKLIFAADNDRWKLVPREGREVNPGVWAASRAAKELNAAYCVPDFPDLSTKPTDYDDLRQLTNLAVVREWLDPAKASEAVTTTTDSRNGTGPEAGADDPPEPKTHNSSKRKRKRKKQQPRTGNSEEAPKPPIITRDSKGLRRALDHLGIQFRYNTRAAEPEIRKSGGARWKALTDEAEAKLMENVAEACRFRSNNQKSESTGRAQFGAVTWVRSVRALSEDSAVDPFLDWLASLPKWDGIPRIDGLLTDLFEVPKGIPKKLTAWAGRHLTMGAVTRARIPGYKLGFFPFSGG
ncbi:MAG: hypothetical protein OXK74_08930 [Gemmatimonadota bacterium]|nr:hypothetical protein [Gemmatimonadota bacterium]